MIAGNPARVITIHCDTLDPCYALPIIQGAAQCLNAAGQHVVAVSGSFSTAPICSDDQGGKAFPSCADALLLIAAPLRQTQAELERAVSTSSKRVVSIGQTFPNAASVSANDEVGVFQAVGHLARRHQRKHIAFIAGPADSADGERRLAAYRMALDNFGLAWDPFLVTRGDYESLSGGEAVRVLRRAKRGTFDAVVAANDLMAIGAMAGLRSMGVRVPEEVSVIGFDDLEEAAFTTPSLSTIRQPLYEQGVSAAGLILDAFEGMWPPEPQVVESPFVIRRSCGCPAPAAARRPSVPPPGTATSDPGSVRAELVEEALRGMVRRQLAQQRVRRALLRLGEQLLAATDFPELASTMTDIYRLLEMRRLLLCVYGANQRTARVMLESSGREVVFRNQGLPFPTTQLVPAGFFKSNTPAQVIVQPLQIAGEHFGYLVIDTELREYADHGELYMCVSGALSRIARGRELRRSYAVEKQVEARAGRTPPLSSGDESLP